MPTRLVSQAAEQILQGIVDGDFAPGKPLPPETELAALLEVSRPTMREAVRTLASQGVLQVRHGVGTFVQPVAQWTDMRAIIRFESHNLDPRTLGLKLVELRRMIEVGAAGLAAANRTEEDVQAMHNTLDQFDQAEAAGDLQRVSMLDIEFHNQLVRASKNPFLSAILQGIQEELAISRAATTAQDQIRQRAKTHHRNIFQAISRQDATGAKEAMRAHMTQTKEDIAAFL